MKGDFTRSTFDSRKHYSSVRMQQGRVQLDADWNEQMDILGHRVETETVDVIGRCGFPKHAPGFEIKELDGDLLIGPGRGYVDGILCELEADPEVTFKTQPHLPGAADLLEPERRRLLRLSGRLAPARHRGRRPRHPGDGAGRAGHGDPRADGLAGQAPPEDGKARTPT